MLQLNGITLVRDVRETGRTLPVLMCTTENQEQRIEGAVKAGVNEYIIIAFSPEGLNQKINRSLGKAVAST